jgi:hypothetical protein
MPSLFMRDVARRLLAVEATKSPFAPHEHEAVRVCEKLRISLTRFAGPDGFTSLLRRAVALARAEVPALQGIDINSDGSLEGLEQFAAGASKTPSGGDRGAEAAVAITAQLLGLLVAFIGEPLTLRLVREAWPDVSLDELQSRIEAP